MSTPEQSTAVETEKETTMSGPSDGHVADNDKDNNNNNDSDGMQHDNDLIPLKENGLETYFPDPDIDTPPALETIAWWAEFTSIHGVYYAFERGHFERWKLFAWSVFVAACTGSLIWLLIQMIEEYKEFKLNTASETIIPTSMDFPQVTVCNTNIFQSSLQSSTGISSPANEEELESISQPLDEFMIYTSFNNVVQINTTFDQIWIPTITGNGQCFSFNNTGRRVLKPGPSSGLEFWTWLDQDEYTEDTFNAGLYVSVVQSGTTLISDQTSTSLVPSGVAAFLSIGRQDIERVTIEPWQRCYSKAPEYTNAVCRTECLHNTTRDACGCRQIGDPVPGLPYCDVNTSIEVNETTGNVTSFPCSLLVSDAVLSGCDCELPPCEEQVYFTSYSANQLSRVFIDSVRRDYFPTASDEQIRQNLVRVVVNFDSIRYQRVFESQDKTLGQLISDMGGQMGFFMGISVISVVELFVELIGLRLLPRLFGDKRLYGIGQRGNRKELGVVQ